MVDKKIYIRYTYSSSIWLQVWQIVAEIGLRVTHASKEFLRVE